MNKKTTPYIYLFLTSLFFSNIYCQEKRQFVLEIFNSSIKEQTHALSPSFIKNFSTEKKLKETKDSLYNAYKRKGYYTLTQDSLRIKKKQFTYYINLGERISNVVLKIDPKDLSFLESINLSPKNNYLHLKTTELQKTLNKINNQLEKEGKLFSTVNLSSVVIAKSKLTAVLHIKRSKKRALDKIIVKGYTNFPKSFIKNYLNIDKNNNLNSELIEEISSKINQLEFVKEIKKPEILFTNDSTIIYLYINKVKTNSFDGLINFNSENKKLKFRGYVDLKLQNTFHKGEKININWRNNGDNRQELNLKTSIPYIAGTKFTPTVSFNLYKHDSTFVNSNTNLTIHYPINKRVTSAIILENETSKVSTNEITTENYSKNSLGIGIVYNSKIKDKLNFEMAVFHKTRKTENSASYLQLNINSVTNFKISKTITFSLKNTSRITNYKTELINELFRSGGVNSIRGFQTNAILSNAYSFINSEIKINSTDDNFLYTIHDIGIFNMSKQNDILSAIGLGYEFKQANTKFNLDYTISNPTSNNTLKSSMVSIKMLTFF